MKRIMAAAAFTAGLGLAACSQGDAEKAKPADAAAPPAAAAPASTAVAADAAPASPPLVAASPAAPDAPAFAALYPGAVVTDPAITALGPDGRPGGIVTFTTAATPDTVVGFYRERAEAAGLASTNTLNRGNARAYGATSSNAGGAMLNVVADAVADGQTHVQLSWTAAK